MLIRKASGQINDETVFEEILYKNLDTDEIAEESYIDDYIAILPKVFVSFYKLMIDCFSII